MSGKTGTTESHRSSGFVGFTNQYAAANYIFADSSTPSGICSFPLRECGSGDLYGGNEPARTWFEAMKPIATDFGEVHLPPTDPRYVDGAPGGRVPSVSGLKRGCGASAAQGGRFPGRRSADIGEQLSAVMAPWWGPRRAVKPFPGSIITINISNGIAPAPPPRPVERPPDIPPPPPPEGMPVVEIPGLSRRSPCPSSDRLRHHRRHRRHRHRHRHPADRRLRSCERCCPSPGMALRHVCFAGVRRCLIGA